MKEFITGEGVKKVLEFKDIQESDLGIYELALKMEGSRIISSPIAVMTLGKITKIYKSTIQIFEI